MREQRADLANDERPLRAHAHANKQRATANTSDVVRKWSLSFVLFTPAVAPGRTLFRSINPRESRVLDPLRFMPPPL